MELVVKDTHFLITTLHHMQVALKQWNVYSASHAGRSETMACLH
jgi:hypothetical protein